RAQEYPEQEQRHEQAEHPEVDPAFGYHARRPSAQPGPLAEHVALDVSAEVDGWLVGPYGLRDHAGKQGRVRLAVQVRGMLRNAVDDRRGTNEVKRIA